MSFTTDNENDNYTTDKKGWEMILDFIPKDKKIWSPFYNDGKQKQYFKELGIDIIHEDKDFFSYTPNYEIICDNPPFSKFKEICIKLKELDKPFILVCPSRTLQLKHFQNKFKNHLQIIIPNVRPTFTKLNTESNNYTPPFGVMYMCYKMNLHKDLIFI